MKHTETINSRSWAREARRHCRIRNAGKPGAGILAWRKDLGDLGSLVARPCYVRERNADYTGSIVLTGGWIIVARCYPAGGLYARGEKTFRVPGPADLGKLARYMGAAEVWLRQQRPIWAARNALHDLVDTKHLPAGVRETAESVGLPMEYDRMSVDDCAKWTEIVKGWEDKAA